MPEHKRNSPTNAGIFADVPAFVQGLAFADLPADVVAQARRCLLDLIGVATAGSRTRAAQIVNNYAATQLRNSETEARMLFEGRRASPAGAAFSGAATIDSYDAHDGHVLIKGHAGEFQPKPIMTDEVDRNAPCPLENEFVRPLPAASRLIACASQNDPHQTYMRLESGPSSRRRRAAGHRQNARGHSGRHHSFYLRNSYTFFNSGLRSVTGSPESLSALS